MVPSTIIPRIRLRNARAWAPRTPVRWIVAFLVFLAAFLVRYALHDLLGPRFPLVLFTVATVGVHFFYGLAPAVVLALASVPVADFFFVPPYLELSVPDAEDGILLSFYVLSTVVYMVLIQYLRRAQYQSVLLAEIAESRHLMLMDSEADRAAIEAEIQRRED
jgi:K+-sensing histidine kinase KdpD